MRKINLHISNELAREAKTALDYLIFWAWFDEPDGYDEVNIYPEGKENMLVVYTASGNPDKKFAMGAIKSKDGKYSFHS